MPPGPRHFAIGLVATAASPARVAAGVGVRVWRHPLLAPVRAPARAAYSAVGRRGERAEESLVRAGPLTERLTDAIVESGIIERVAAQVVRSDALEHWVDALLDDEQVEQLVARVLDSHLVAVTAQRLGESDEVLLVAGSVARSPVVREALQVQSTGLANELAEETRRRTARVDEVLERAARRLLKRRRRGEPTITVATDGPP
jgi:hypothetical protein